MLGNHLNRLSTIFWANTKLEILEKLLKTCCMPTNDWLSNVIKVTISPCSSLLFPPNLGPVSVEHGEQFHQDIALIKSRYKGKVSASMIANYCWFLQRENDFFYNRSAIPSKLL